MTWLTGFEEEMNYTVVINGKIMISAGDDGQPVYNDVLRYSGKAAFWKISSNERFAMQRVGNNATHNIVFDPSLVLSDIQPADTAIIDGVTYSMRIGCDILGLGDINLYQLEVKQ